LPGNHYLNAQNSYNSSENTGHLDTLTSELVAVV
jgi:hypothetical protein